jgi:hypothetical protein
LQNGGEFRVEIYFSTDKVADRVHASVDRPGALGPPWTDGGADRGGAGARWRAHRSSTSGPPVHQSSPAGAQQREERTGSSARASSGLGRRRGDRATAVARRGHGKLGVEGFRRGRGEEKGAVRCGVLRGSSGWLL